MNGRSELHRLLGAVWGHLEEHRLPEPWSLTCELYRAEVQVQIGPGAPVARLADLLAWAYSLQEATVRWRRLDIRSLHTTVHGRTRAGVWFRVFGGLDFTDTRGLVPLAPGDTEVATVEELHVFHDLLAEHEVQL
ncbi:hypothetical protein [Amycolatopsis jiangsuensis]|uniref:Uncharacterized protein n=1 Tax=Amycolatopsis jiangsuensis TaxID=1181879 RepID=A0A840J1P5_9PSEU|nr:hypothetical protein [Amycolatopsis jiangsuensis]MBB4687407.1 hypothetical protein [Amycolatopsis jiangsuensis]